METNLHILYVEDDLLSRRVMEILLKNSLKIKQVTIFEDSSNFLGQIEQLSSIPDIVFLDIHMQPIDGFAMLVALRELEEYSNVPVVALTASVMSEEVEQLRKSGFNGCIAKPLDVDLFKESIPFILSGQEIWRITG